MAGWCGGVFLFVCLLGLFFFVVVVWLVFLFVWFGFFFFGQAGFWIKTIIY